MPAYIHTINPKHIISKRNGGHVRLNPNVSVDCVIFGFDGIKLKVLLIDRDKAEVQNGGNKIYALPGDLIRNDEDLDNAADRVLNELTGLQDIFLEQFGSFGDPDRLTKEKDLQWLKSIRAEPEARVITVAYYSLIRSDHFELHASGFASEAFWHNVDEMPELGFDHLDIVQVALSELRFRCKFQPLGFELLPEKFTLTELQNLYEAIFDKELDKRNFRRRILKMDFLNPLKQKQIGVPNKPAQFFSFNREKYDAYKSNDFYFTL